MDIKKCWFFLYHKRLYWLCINWLVLRFKQEVQGLQVFTFTTATVLPSLFYKLVSIVSVPMSPVSNGSYGSTDTTFYNIKAKHLPN